MPSFTSMLWGVWQACIGAVLGLLVGWFGGLTGFFVTLSWYFLCISILNYDWQIRFVRLCQQSPETAMLMVTEIAKTQEKSVDGN